MQELTVLAAWQSSSIPWIVHDRHQRRTATGLHSSSTAEVAADGTLQTRLKAQQSCKNTCMSAYAVRLKPARLIMRGRNPSYVMAPSLPSLTRRREASPTEMFAVYQRDLLLSRRHEDRMPVLECWRCAPRSVDTKVQSDVHDLRPRFCHNRHYPRQSC